MTAPEIHVSAVLISDPSGRALMVRKTGTTAFMQPGGKPEAGENAAQTAIREIREELGIALDELALRPLGTFRTAAANEAGFDVVADCFAVTIEHCDPTPTAEIAEARWLAPADVDELDIAPLSAQVLLPLLWSEAPESA